MGITADEGIQLLLTKGLPTYQSIVAAIKALPPKETRTAKDYAAALGCAPGTPGFNLADLIDAIEADAKS